GRRGDADVGRLHVGPVRRDRGDGGDVPVAGVGRVLRGPPADDPRPDEFDAGPVTVADVEYDDVWKQFPSQTAAAVHGLSLKIPDRELLVLLGPSGCGKTTALRML